MINKRLILFWLAINFALTTKTRAEALDIITDTREKRGKSPNIKEADAFFDAVRDIAESKETTKNKRAKVWDLVEIYTPKI